MLHFIEVHVGVERNLLEVTADAEHFVLLMSLLVGLHTLEQFGEVLEAIGVVVFAKQFLVTAFFEHHVKHVADDMIAALRADHGAVLIEENGQFHAFFDELAALFNEVDEVYHRLLVEFTGTDVALQSFVERRAILVGKSLEATQVSLAHLSAGHVADAQEGEVVTLVDEAQVGEGILDLGAVEEADAAPNDVVNASMYQRLFDVAAQVTGAVEDGEVAEGGSGLFGTKIGSDINGRRAGRVGIGGGCIVCFGAEGADLADNPAGFFLVAASVEMGHLGAAVACGEEVLGHAVTVATDDGIGDVENGGGGAVILVEDDGLVVRELDKHLGTCSTPLVDGLIGVTYNEEVVMDALQRFDNGPVALVAVLCLIEHNVLHLVLPVLASVGEALEDMDGEEDKVLEVETQCLLLQLQVTGKSHFGSLLGFEGRGVEILAEPFREHHAVDVVGLLQEESHLAVGSGIEELSDSFDGAVQSQFLHHLLGKLLLVVFVEDSERLGITKAVDLLSQELDTEAMDGADEVVVVATAHEAMDTLSHLLCRLVGEGEAEDVGRIDTQHVDQIGIAAGERLGLARPRSGHYADSPLGGLYCFALPTVQAADVVVHFLLIILIVQAFSARIPA